VPAKVKLARWTVTFIVTLDVGAWVTLQPAIFFAFLRALRSEGDKV
jgi:hypothetical protein